MTYVTNGTSSAVPRLVAVGTGVVTTVGGVFVTTDARAQALATDARGRIRCGR